MDFLEIDTLPDIQGIFLTHAHIGHYAGLVNFGLECMNLKNIPVYVFPKMRIFLKSNSIFQQLIKNKNVFFSFLSNIYFICIPVFLH